MANHKTKPPAAGMGRVPGSQNKTTKALKEAILEAAEAFGKDGKGKDGLQGYLFHLADKEPKTFGALLGRVLPTQISGEISLIDRLSYEDRVALEGALREAVASGEGDAADGAPATQH